MSKILAFLAKIKASPEAAQQWAHFSIPLLSFLTLYRFHLIGWEFLQMGLALFLLIFWVTFALVVELWFDPVEEHDPFWPKGFRDTCFYAAGTILGFVLTL